MSWQDELVKGYPLLFRSGSSGQASGYPAVGDGWQVLVETAIRRIDAAVGKLVRDEKANLSIKQIKEKLGGLRIYLDWTGLPSEAAAKVNEAVDLAEARASCTCEICGAAGVVRDRDGWYLTRCERHAEGEPVPMRHEAYLHIEFKMEDREMRVSRCRRYDRERDTFVDAPLPSDETWARKD